MVPLLLTLNIFYSFLINSIVDFEQVNVFWVGLQSLVTSNNICI